jgi:hypothetical protein
MLAPNALSTLETFKGFAGVSGNSEDTKLEIILSGASAFIEKWSGRRFKKETRTEKINPSGDSARMYLRAAPIVSVTSLTFDGAVLPTSDYVLANEAGFLSKVSGYWAKGVQTAVVVYEGGYVLPKDATEQNPRTLPYDIELAVLKLATGFYNRSSAEGTNSSSSGGMSVTFGDVFGEDIKALLRPYRYIHV